LRVPVFKGEGRSSAWFREMVSGKPKTPPIKVMIRQLLGEGKIGNQRKKGVSLFE